MTHPLVMGILTATHLLLPQVAQFDNSQPTEAVMATIALDERSEYEAEDQPTLTIHERLLYMRPAEPESAETQSIRREVTETLEEQERLRAEAEAERLTQEERDRLTTEWEDDYPIVDGETAEAIFINSISREAVDIAHRNNLYPSVMMAQAGLESNWGRSGLARNYNNLMGTKGSWNGQSVNMRTREDIGGQSIYIDAGFSVYDSWGDSLERYGQLLRNGPSGNAAFYAGAWRSHAETTGEATQWLQGRYATDTQYAAKLDRIISRYNLEQFDSVRPLDDDLEQIAILPEPDIVNIETPEGFYEVEEGDSLFGIAFTEDILIEELVSWNNLQAPVLQAGQWLAIEPTDNLLTVEDLLATTDDDAADNDDS